MNFIIRISRYFNTTCSFVVTFVTTCCIIIIAFAHYEVHLFDAFICLRKCCRIETILCNVFINDIERKGEIHMEHHHHAHWFRKLSAVQLLLTFYFLAILASTLLLLLPVAYFPGVSISFIDVLFTAVSALSVTGLSTISIANTFSTTGVVFLVIILQLGAVGVMAIGTFLWMLLGKKVSVRERRLIMTDQNQTTFGGVVKLIQQIVAVLLIIEVISTIVFTIYYLKYFPTLSEAFVNGLFSTISAISNGGFDITGNSLITYQDDYFIQIMTMGLIIIGAIGFPVLVEVKEFVMTPRKKRRFYRFSLFTKVTTTTFAALIVFGTIFIYVIDMNYFFKGMTVNQSFFASLFQSVTTRSGGLSTIPVEQLREQNHLFMSILMFIGASPSSAGGGIRTTTFALVVIFIITYARGGKGIRIFRREVYDQDLKKAVTVTLMALILIISSLFAISIIEPSYSIMQILFEVASAFGTVGLSLGITGDLTIVSKCILMLLMFIGRVGVITFLFMFTRHPKPEAYSYPKERIIIG